MRWAAALLLVGLSVWSAPASAHAVGFGAWRLEATGGDRWRSTLRVDGAEGALSVEVEGCTQRGVRREQEGPTTRLVSLLVCPGGPGPAFGVEGLPEHMRVHGTLVPRAGPERTFLLRAEDPRFELAAAEDPGPTYLLLGIQHILAGWDHVAFVLALMVLLWADRRGWRRILTTLSAFTVGHSLTLGLAAWEVLRVDPALTEAMIAASLVLLAVELAPAPPDRERPPGAPSLTRRAPELVALFFGLFHGLGFAGVLQEIGLPPAHALLALVAFNGGVEVGQLLVAAAAGLVLVALRATGARGAWVGDPGRIAGAYVLGCAGVVVALERVFA